MLEIKGLNYSYDGDNNILDSVNFKIKEGYIYCLLGENGAGKTTLFKCLNGELQCNLSDFLGNEDILFIHDEMKFYYYLTGKEYINLIIDIKNRKLDDKYYEDLICRLKMEDKIDSKIFSYSLGMKHKLVLILAFLLGYKYILLDEPFTALDYVSSDTIIDIAKEYANKNNSIIISTHMMDMAQEISDKILLLKNGRIIEFDNKFINSRELKDEIKKISS